MVNNEIESEAAEQKNSPSLFKFLAPRIPQVKSSVFPYSHENEIPN